MRTHLIPLNENKSFNAHCNVCDHFVDFFLECVSVDWKDKTITMKFFCAGCKDTGWRKIIVKKFET